MQKVFGNKEFAYVIIAVLSALQLTQSIANWCGGGFTGGSLILCIMMLGLLVLVGVGISKKNKLLTIVCGVSILSVVIYVLVSQYSGIIVEGIERNLPPLFFLNASLSCSATLLLIGCFILVVLKAFGANKNLEKVNIVFSLVSVVFTLITIIMTLTNGISDPGHTVNQIIYSVARDFMAIFIALLIPCVWHQLEEIKE